MAALASRAANRIMVSTSAWEPTLNHKCEVLPIPSNIPYVPDEIGTAEIRKQYATRGRLLGHFGSFGALIRDLLTDAILLILQANPDVDVLVMGSGSDAFTQCFRSTHEAQARRVHSIGALPNTILSKYISACDVMLQPFPDGVTTRRTTVMAALLHGRAIVTNAGHLTESIWKEERAVRLCDDSSASTLAEATRLLLFDESARQSLGKRAFDLYASRFDIRHTLKAITTLPQKA
jgi:glycosyltransferase involved in cell wall biosynthesis